MNHRSRRAFHSIQASKLGMKEKAYEMYLRTARLDLDDYNNDTEDGCHITSMAGTWLAVVKGFGGFRIETGTGNEARVILNPYCPDNWQSLSFKIRFRGVLLQVTTTQQDVTVHNFSSQPIAIQLLGKDVTVKAESHKAVSTKMLA